MLLLAPIYWHDRLAPEERLDVRELVRQLVAAGVDARACDSFDHLLATALDTARRGDVMVTMSSGSFDSLPQLLLQALAGEPGARLLT